MTWLKKLQDRLNVNRLYLSFSDIFVVVLIFIISQSLVGLILSASNQENIYDTPLLALISYIAGGMSLVGFLLYFMKKQKIPISLLHIKKPNLKDIGYALIGYVSYMIILVASLAVITAVFPSFNLNQAQDLGIKTNLAGPVLIVVYIALVIMPPISEELLFRGFLYGRLKSHRVPRIIAALLTSALFGIFHGQLNIAIDTFILSLAMIAMLEKRKSLWVTFFMHVIKNSVAFVGLFVIRTSVG